LSYLVEDGEVRYAVVLATPDDEGHPRGKPDEKRFRARQNVVLELGVLLEAVCANPTCPTPEKVVVLTGKAGIRARSSGRWYCGPDCANVGGRAYYAAARYPNGRIALKTVCANADCPTPEKALVLRGRARSNAIARPSPEGEGPPS
jgi:hypothetical protein